MLKNVQFLSILEDSDQLRVLLRMVEPMAVDQAAIISVTDLAFSRGEKPIFLNLNISIPKGKVVAIMGPSGTGKTTLLNLIGGQLKPDRGTILIDGENPHQLRKKELFKLRRKLGMLFQEGGLFSDFNVYENVAFSLRQHTNLSEDLIHDLVLMFLEAVGLRGAASLRIDELSGGMARRVALARAIVMGPKIMLYDEPFTGQDPIGRGVLIKLIRELNDALGLTSVLVSHDVQETAELADYVYIISEGVVMGEGTPELLLQDKNPSVDQFVHGLPDGPVRFQYPAKDFREDLWL